MPRIQGRASPKKGCFWPSHYVSRPMRRILGRAWAESKITEQTGDLKFAPVPVPVILVMYWPCTRVGGSGQSSLSTIPVHARIRWPLCDALLYPRYWWVMPAFQLALQAVSGIRALTLFCDKKKAFTQQFRHYARKISDPDSDSDTYI